MPSFTSTRPVLTVEGRASPAFADLDGDGDLDAFGGAGYGDAFHFEWATALGVDESGGADGVRSVEPKTENGGASLTVNASNDAKRGQTTLPGGIAGALSGVDEVTLQLQTGAGCFETTLTDIRQRTSERFDAR